ncbi:IclR family transcriptional regulator, pca regulon regulatory protein [Ketogulonicigenium robustum]|uniref:IclR family transcriptional regulator, pca regulon regulatory protein n=1 Tax=Ketogulonicigenium robustum TaxID=92947 RepID=A0A1W6P1A6_9RHOB|nr:IclR family transcriptional regulator C-terminal domain-containing protein [Ketogulonicigenium robustum]ARO15292.1 IclR family transcriptional regulator, pca regulon regulatory protein [Ketogulonicigenium robustum]
MIPDRDTMGGLAKGLMVIEAFGADTPRLSITEAAARTGLDRATARRCLLTLVQHGYADHDGKFFTLTPRVLRLGVSCLAAMPLPQIVQPYLDKLTDIIGESSSVSILDGAEIVYVARASQRKVMSIALMPGSRLPAHCTSMGRVMLAALPADQAAARLGAASLPARTPHTRTNPAAVLALLGPIRAQGYAVIEQEVEIGLRSIAVPLQNAHGRTVAAVNIGTATTRTPAQDLTDRLLPALLYVQRELRGLLK